MKYLSALLCLFLCYQLSTQIPHGPGKHGPHAKYEKDCMDSAGITKEEMEEMEKHSEELEDQILNGEGDYKKLGCFMACMFQHHGIMEGSSFNVTREDHHHQPDSSDESNEKWQRFVKIREDCVAGAEGAGDECDTALAFEVCMHKNLKLNDL